MESYCPDPTRPCGTHGKPICQNSICVEKSKNGCTAPRIQIKGPKAIYTTEPLSADCKNEAEKEDSNLNKNKYYVRLESSNLNGNPTGHQDGKPDDPGCPSGHFYFVDCKSQKMIDSKVYC